MPSAEDDLRFFYRPIDGGVVPVAADVFERLPGLAAIEGQGALAVEHEAGHATGGGIELECEGGFAAAGDFAVVAAREGGAAVGGFEEAVAGDDEEQVAGGAIDRDAGGFAGPDGFLAVSGEAGDQRV